MRRHTAGIEANGDARRHSVADVAEPNTEPGSDYTVNWCSGWCMTR